MKYHQKHLTPKINSSWWLMALTLAIFLWLDSIGQQSFRSKLEAMASRPIQVIGQFYQAQLNILNFQGDKAKQIQLVTTARQELAGELAQVSRLEELKMKTKLLKPL